MRQGGWNLDCADPQSLPEQIRSLEPQPVQQTIQYWKGSYAPSVLRKRDPIKAQLNPELMPVKEFRDLVRNQEPIGADSVSNLLIGRSTTCCVFHGISQHNPGKKRLPSTEEESDCLGRTVQYQINGPPERVPVHAQRHFCSLAAIRAAQVTPCGQNKDQRIDMSSGQDFSGIFL
jgi:hypothetical protein